jgi:hypothetical protein
MALRLDIGRIRARYPVIDGIRRREPAELERLLLASVQDDARLRVAVLRYRYVLADVARRRERQEGVQVALPAGDLDRCAVG